jgi:hypothetical protein
MLICSKCLSEGSFIQSDVRIPCHSCNETGYKTIGEELYRESNDEQM